MKKLKKSEIMAFLRDTRNFGHTFDRFYSRDVESIVYYPVDGLAYGQPCCYEVDFKDGSWVQLNFYTALNKVGVLFDIGSRSGCGHQTVEMEVVR